MDGIVFLEPMLHFFPLTRRDDSAPAGNAGFIAVLSHEVAQAVQHGNYVLSTGTTETEPVVGRFEFIFHNSLYQAAISVKGKVFPGPGARAGYGTLKQYETLTLIVRKV